MAVPDFQSFFVPVLRATADGKEHSSSEIREKVAAELGLTREELDQKLPSGTQTVFANRVTWSTVYLTKAGALERPRRGSFQITERGQELLRQYPTRFTKQALSAYPEFVAFSKGQLAESGEPEEKSNTQLADESTRTPEEDLISAYQKLRRALANEVLEAVKKSTPRFFEELVVDLLVAMGYGGSVTDAGRAVGRSGDDGIDGIIKEDKLGLDLVYIQAKRWKDSVGRPVIQAFAGSLEGVRARKGVFITTSTFTAEAIEYVHRIERKIVLIDGTYLSDLMIEHNVGVTVTQTFMLKRLDSDYFETA
jgi:restriction system protein